MSRGCCGSARPLFHFGILFVIVGHVGGLVIPKSWTEAVGISQELYHVNALLIGGHRRVSARWSGSRS